MLVASKDNFDPVHKRLLILAKVDTPAAKPCTHLAILPGELAQLAVFRLGFLVYLLPPAVHRLIVEELLSASVKRLALSTETLLNVR